MQGGLGHAADGLNVRSHLGGGKQAAVAGLGALTDLDEHACGIHLHAGQRLDDAVQPKWPDAI